MYLKEAGEDAKRADINTVLRRLCSVWRMVGCPGWRCILDRASLQAPLLKRQTILGLTRRPQKGFQPPPSFLCYRRSFPLSGHFAVSGLNCIPLSFKMISLRSVALRRPLMQQLTRTSRTSFRIAERQRVIGRRGYASGHGEVQEGSDLPW